MDNLLQVKITSPQEVMYEGKARAVSSQNSKGRFDILPQHANFVSILENQPIEIVKEDGQKVSFKLDQAIIHHANNIVSIFANIPNEQMLQEINKLKAI